MADSGIATNAVAVDDSAAALLTSATGMSRRRTIWLFNNDDADTVFIGGADVTAADGYPLVAGGSFPIVGSREESDATIAWYGICDTGDTAEVRVLEVSN